MKLFVVQVLCRFFEQSHFFGVCGDVNHLADRLLAHMLAATLTGIFHTPRLALMPPPDATSRQGELNNPPHLSAMRHQDTVLRRALCERVSESHRPRPRRAAKLL